MAGAKLRKRICAVSRAMLLSKSAQPATMRRIRAAARFSQKARARSFCRRQDRHDANRPRRTRSERFKPTRVGEGSLALAIAAAVRVCNGVCTFPPLIGSPTARSFGAPQLRVSQLANNWQKAGFWRFRQTDKLAGANGESLAVGARGRI